MSFEYDLKAAASRYDFARFDGDKAAPMPWDFWSPNFAGVDKRRSMERLSRCEWRDGILAQRIDRLPEINDVDRALLRAHIKPGTARARVLLLGWIRGERWAEAVAHYAPQSNPFREAFQVALDNLLGRGFVIIYGKLIKGHGKGPGIFLCHNKITDAMPRWPCTWCNPEGRDFSPDPDPCPGCSGAGWIGTLLPRHLREIDDKRAAQDDRRARRARAAIFGAVDAAVVRSVDGTIARVHRPAPGSLEFDADENVEAEP